MFEKDMSAKLRRIFGIEKVVYDTPGESQEQEGIFIGVIRAHTKTVDARQIAKVEGVIRVFANLEKLPYGYFAKRIAEASLSDTRGFFFGPEENSGTFRNIVERKLEFTFLFDSQYDPAIGSITSINTSVTET